MGGATFDSDIDLPYLLLAAICGVSELIAPYRYSAFGLAIDSDFELNGLPPDDPAGGPPDVTFRRGYVPRTRGKTTASEEIAFNTLAGGFHIREGRDVVVQPLPGIQPEVLSVILLGRMMATLMRQRGWLPLHGSAISIRGSAAIFVGPSGSGKSTTAAAFARAGFEVLTDDVAAVRVVGDDVVICPSWPRLRLFDDSLGIVQDRSLRSVWQLDKHTITLSSPTLHRLMGTRRIYLLNPGDSLALRRVVPAAAAALLSMNTFLKFRRSDAPSLASHLRDCAEVGARTVVSHLIRPVALDAVQEIVRLVEEDLHGNV